MASKLAGATPRKSGRTIKPPIRYADEDDDTFSARKKAKISKSRQAQQPNKMTKEEKAAIRARVRRAFDKSRDEAGLCMDDPTFDKAPDGDDSIDKDFVIGDMGEDSDFLTDELTELTDESRNAPSGYLGVRLLFRKYAMFSFLLLSALWPVFATFAAETLVGLLHLCIAIAFASAGCWAKFAIAIIAGLSQLIMGLVMICVSFAWRHWN